ncbi:MAG: hypothetical protein LBT09_05205 [Planctomycetaceae bacterium]|nr:hypothetical protein [Planctomycetaceae bacterium]
MFPEMPPPPHSGVPKANDSTSTPQTQYPQIADQLPSTPVANHNNQNDLLS